MLQSWLVNDEISLIPNPDVERDGVG